MTGWQIQYWNGAAWTAIPNVQVNHILEELGSVGGQEEFCFSVPNNATSRAIIQPKPFVQALFGEELVFPLAPRNAIVSGISYSPTKIGVTAYNYVYVQLKQATQTVTQNYVNASIAFIAAYICGLAGVDVGEMPPGNVSIKFNNANPFKAMQDPQKQPVVSFGATVTDLTSAPVLARFKRSLILALILNVGLITLSRLT